MIRAMFAVAVCVSAAGPAAGQDIYERPYWVDRSIVEAQGRSQVLVPADEASFSVTFTAVAGDARAALFSASDRARLPVAAIRVRGGDSTRITSEAAVTAIYREYRNGEGERVSSERSDQIDNYAATVTLGVRVSDVPRALDARAAALAVGPEEVGDLEFRLTESSPARLQAYRAAVQDAAARAAINAQYLRGDLDNIVLKALKKEPERRYSSAENLAEDIRRHQQGLTVTARPDVFSYRAAKFIRRNRFTVGAGALILLAVFAGLVATLWQARVAASERDNARQQALKAERINAYCKTS